MLTVTETDPSSSPLRAAGVSRCVVLVHQGPAGEGASAGSPNAAGASANVHPGDALDARTLERAAQSLEDFLTQPRKIKE